jgi:hypothetical protein
LLFLPSAGLGRLFSFDLLLYKFKFLGFQKLLWNTLRVLLTAQAQGPKFLAELRGIFVEEASELNLEFLHIRIARAFQEVEAEFDHDVIFISKNLRDTFSDPFFHHFNVHLGHIHLPRELRRELGGLQQLLVHWGRHFRRMSRCCRG